MGLFSGRRAVDDTPQRSMTLPFDLSALTPGVSITDYATVDANGENALRDIAIGSAIDLICSLTSEMPVDVYRGYGSDRQRVNMPANLKDPGADGHGLQDWLYTLLQSWLYRGNAYGHIVSMSAAGDARQVALLHPDQVVATSDGDGRVAWMVNGQRLDERAERMFIHRRVNPVPGRVLGASVIERHAMQIGTSLAAAKFGLLLPGIRGTDGEDELLQEDGPFGIRSLRVKKAFMQSKDWPGFTLVTCLEGKCEVTGRARDNLQPARLHAGDTVLFPASFDEFEIFPEDEAWLIQSWARE